MATVHPPELHTHPASDLICDICGVNQSTTGKRFTLPSQVWQHKKKRHPEALKSAKPPVPPRVAERRPSIQASRVEPKPSGSPAPVVASPLTEVSADRREFYPPKNDALKFCPSCGYHLAAVHTAMDLDAMKFCPCCGYNVAIAKAAIDYLIRESCG